ncbi:MAG: hypothetical protein P4L40_04940 [Terracidiphilus sp.]|nr:hypothetical protein [Terracidiphilus sp.]
MRPPSLPPPSCWPHAPPHSSRAWGAVCLFFQSVCVCVGVCVCVCVRV